MLFHRFSRTPAWRGCCAGCVLALTLIGAGLARAQAPATTDADTPASASPADPLPAVEADAAQAAAPAVDPRLNLLDLLIKGGWLMVPIGISSVIALMVVLERCLALRRRRVMPRELLEGLADLGAVPGVMDPRAAYRLCQQYPSSAAVVIRAMLLRIGRPQSEVEHAVAEASEREAERLYTNVRWLTLIAAVAPLMGLFGTVWGMIHAFFDTTQLTAGQNKAEYLAHGIYVALVTTLGGLAVAIPATIFAHYFEGRIQRLFHEIDELLFNLLPQVERFEGRLRVTSHTLGGAADTPVGTRTPAEIKPSDPARVH